MSTQLRSLKHLLNPSSQTTDDDESGNGTSVPHSIQDLNNHSLLTNETSAIGQTGDSSTRATVRSSDRTPLGHPRLSRGVGNSPQSHFSLNHKAPNRSQSPVRLGLTGGSSSLNSQRFPRSPTPVARSPTPPASPGSDEFERELAMADRLPSPALIQAPVVKESRGRDSSDLSKCSFTRPLGKADMAAFNRLTTCAELDEVYLEYAKAHSEIHGTDARYIAGVVTQTRILTNMTTLLEKLDSLENRLEELAHLVGPNNTPNESTSQVQVNKPPITVSNWLVSKELHDTINNTAKKSMTLPNIEAYTALTYNQARLTHSLFNTVRQSLVDRGPDFAKDHLPRKIAGIHDSVGIGKYHSEIRNACKRAREKMHLVILAGIHNQKSGEETEVPVLTIKALNFEIAEKFGIAGQKCDINSVWSSTDEPTRARIAYLRREAARIIQEGGKGSRSIWNAVDKQLGELRGKEDPDFTAAFFKIVYDDDREMFDGKRTFQDVKKLVKFTLPTEDEIRSLMPGTQAQT